MVEPFVLPVGGGWSRVFKYNDIEPYIVAFDEELDKLALENRTFSFVDHVDQVKAEELYPLNG